MTDCYLCGHPILEGQKSVNSRKAGFGTEPVGSGQHFNLQDCLPTLALGADGYAEFRSDVRRTERERAAKMLLEEILLHRPACAIITASLGTDTRPECDCFVGELAARIRSGE